MALSSDELYDRIRAVCCAEWAITPWEFDEAAEQEKIDCKAAFDCLLLASTQPFGKQIFPFLLREHEAEKTQRIERLQWLSMLYKATADPEKRAAIKREVEELTACRTS